MAINRTTKIAGTAVALVALYFGLVFVSGSLAERTARQLEAQGSIALANSRALQVKKIEYQRGFFQSVATGTYALGGMTSTTSEKGPVTFQMRHLITHGPITRSGLGWARTQTEVILDPATAAEVAKVLGDKKPLEIIVRHGFLGGIKGTLSSPAFEVAENGSKFKWGGVEGKFSLGRGGSSLAGDFLVPSLSVAENDGNVTLQNFNLKFDLHRVFEVLYEGTAAAELGEVLYVDAKGETFKIDKMVYAFDVDRKGDFLDAKIRLGSGAVEAQGFKIQKARYDLTIKHVHAPTYASMTKDIVAMSDKMSAGSPDGPPANLYSNMVANMGEVFTKLLEKDPELVIDGIGITTAQGEFGLSGNLKLVGFKPSDVELGPAGAMNKIQANFKVFLDEPLLDMQLPKSKPDDAAEADPSMAGAKQPPTEGASDAPVDRSALHAQVAQMEKAGFLTRTGKRVESRLEMKNGQLTANGKPVTGGRPQ